MKIRTSFVSNSSSSSFAILGIKVTNTIREKIHQLANEECEPETEEYLCCKKCGHEPDKTDVKFCELCGGLMDIATRDIEYEWDCDSERFETLGLDYYSDTDYGEICGLSIDNKTVDQILEIHKKMIEMFGDNLTFKVMSGEYAC